MYFFFFLEITCTKSIDIRRRKRLEPPGHGVLKINIVGVTLSRNWKEAKTG